MPRLRQFEAPAFYHVPLWRAFGQLDITNNLHGIQTTAMSKCQHGEELPSSIVILCAVAALRNSSALRMTAAASSGLLSGNRTTRRSTSGILNVYSDSCVLNTNHAL